MGTEENCDIVPDLGALTLLTRKERSRTLAAMREHIKHAVVSHIKIPNGYKTVGPTEKGDREPFGY